LAESGHSIVGDPVYGRGLRRGKLLNKTLFDFVEKLKYQMLHASRLSFFHPQSGELLTFQTPMRQEMDILGHYLEQE
jgi:23S rRNA pseudouridine1911/1915/1917 synthase